MRRAAARCGPGAGRPRTTSWFWWMIAEGGDRHHLHALGQLLRDNRAPFETRTLPTGFGIRHRRVDVARAAVTSRRCSSSGSMPSTNQYSRRFSHGRRTTCTRAPTHCVDSRTQVGRRRRGVAEGWKVKRAARRHSRHATIAEIIMCSPASSSTIASSARGTGIATPSSRRRVDGVEGDAMIQHEHAIKS